MKVLILFDTKHGFTEKCARYLNDKIEESDIFNINDNFDISIYDKIFLGSYIYKDEISDKASSFLKKYKSKLLNKELRIFCSALDRSDYLSALQKSIDPEIFYHAKIVLSGGRVKFEELNFFEKRKVKKRLDISENTEEFCSDELDVLIELL